MELIYGREFSREEISLQAVREICIQSLLYDSEVEKEHIRQGEQKSKADSGGRMIIGSKNVQDMLFRMKYPEVYNATVTLLTSKEYEQEVGKSKNSN